MFRRNRKPTPMKFDCPVCNADQTLAEPIEINKPVKHFCTECKATYTVIPGAENASFDDVPVIA